MGAARETWFLAGRAGERGPRCDNRRFVDALLWMARSGGRWRDLPERFGDHQAVKRRYYRWIETRRAGQHVLRALTAEADLGMADDQLNHRAGASARGGRTAGKRGADAQGLGRSRGGLSTKIHAASDALGNPVRLIGSGQAQRNDIALAHDLIEGFETQARSSPTRATMPIICVRPCAPAMPSRSFHQNRNRTYTAHL